MCPDDAPSGGGACYNRYGNHAISCEEADQFECEGVRPAIAGYVPGTNVVQHNRIDLDQDEMAVRPADVSDDDWAAGTGT
eukprot:SAG31_NODE_7558_length_1654_cov_5.819936_1_plen_79_part_10